MSKRRVLRGVAALVAAGAATATMTGCFDVISCDFYDNGKCPSATTGAGGGMASGSSSTGVSPKCDPNMGMPIEQGCGIFVDSGKPDGDGSQSSPYNTLDEALHKNPTNKPIYVCTSTAGLNEAIVLKGSEQLYGGLSCGTWQKTGPSTAWKAPANQVPLTLQNTAGARIDGFAIASASASGTKAGGPDGSSSYGVIAISSLATIANSDIAAGDGAPGAAGLPTTKPQQAPGSQSDPNSFSGNSGSGCGGSPGGEKIYSSCPANPTSTSDGAPGGPGGLNQGTDGGSGLPQYSLGPPDGLKGLGQGASACTAGTNGHDGPGGKPGARGTGNGAIDANGLWTGPGAGNGDPGSIGQGGGGGGGSLGNGGNGCSSGQAGPSGAGGGVGGCGGLGGRGGGAGGASIALVSYKSTLTLEAVKLTAGNGGSGGAGGMGQQGGGGGPAGTKVVTAGCKGGDGGNGGDGGGGAGGKGGPSIGLAFVGSQPPIDDSAISIPVMPASGGAGGAGNTPTATGEHGDAGQVVKQQNF